MPMKLDEVIILELSIPGPNIANRLKHALFLHLVEKSKSYCKTTKGSDFITLFLTEAFNLKVEKTPKV